MSDERDSGGIDPDPGWYVSDPGCMGFVEYSWMKGEKSGILTAEWFAERRAKVFWLEDKLYDKLAAYSLAEEINPSDVVTLALEAYFG